MTTPARRERKRFADELELLGPDAPTLNEGWDARDLAAHIVVRDSRPDAAPGILVPAFSGYTAKVQDEVAEQDWKQLVEAVRNGPPFWNPSSLPSVERVMNTAEFFVHLEDLRRAQPDWSARVLEPELIDDLYSFLKRSAKQLTSSAESGIILAPNDHRDSIRAKKGDPVVTVIGPVGELVLWAFGRQSHAIVEFDGPPEAIENLESASFGI